MRKFWAAWLLLLIAAGPAGAVPPASARLQEQRVVRAYMDSVRDNDADAFAGLFAPDAQIIVEKAAPIDAEQWLASERSRFDPARRTRFLSAVGRYVHDGTWPGAAVLLTIEEQHCHPNSTECFLNYRTEALTVVNGKIVRFERSAFSHRINPDGAWDFPVR